MPLPDENTNDTWTLDEFVEHLNQKAPLSSDQDARRADAWSGRLVRHYCSNRALSQPTKRGRNVFYGPRHLEEARQLKSLQDAGASSKFAVLSKSYTPADAHEQSASSSPSFYEKIVETATGRAIAQNRDTMLPQQRAALQLLDGFTTPTPERGRSAFAVQAHGAMAGSSGHLRGGVAVMNVAPKLPNTEAFVPVDGAAPMAWHRWEIVPGIELAVREEHWTKETNLKEALLKLLPPM